MSLGVSSGVVVQASGWTPSNRAAFLEPLPVAIIGSGAVTPVAYFSGSDGNLSLNVNVSGGTISANVSGNVVVISASGNQLLTGFSGALNVNISGGTISANVSGNVVVIAASGTFPLTMFSGALNVNISGGTISTTPPGLQSGTMVLISGGNLAESGLAVTISGESVQILGSGLTQFAMLSGNIAASGNNSLSGLTISGAWVAPFAPVLFDYSGRYFYPIPTAASGLLEIPVNSSGDVSVVVSGGTLPVSLVSGFIAALSGLVVGDSGQALTVSGNSVVVLMSGNIPLYNALSASGSTNQSGVLVVSLVAWDSGAALFRPVMTGLSGQARLAVGIGTANIAAAGDAASNNNVTLYVTGFLETFNNSTWDKHRNVWGASGNKTSGGSIGIPVGVQGPYVYSNITGAAGITNVWQSGSVLLHTIIINQLGGSGAQVQIRDASSGVAGTLVGTLFGSSGNQPTMLLYDSIFVTGLVVSTSGASPTWDLTLNYRVV